jgi:large subunit ribosomal protein L6
MTAKKDTGISHTINLPEGVTATLQEAVLTLKGPAGENSRDFFNPLIQLAKKDNTIIVSSRSVKRKFTRVLNTIKAHINNQIVGANEGFTYEMKICSGHFPMTVKKEGSEVVVTNFLGEKIPRRATIVSGVGVEIKGEDITVKSSEIENAGQTAANIEKATFIKKRDRRTFQDGCYITLKPSDKK